MNKKQDKKSLRLATQTLRSLDGADLSAAQGGGTVITGTKCPGYSTECTLSKHNLE